jgi:hypothetical protein
MAPTNYFIFIIINPNEFTPTQAISLNTSSMVSALDIFLPRSFIYYMSRSTKLATCLFHFTYMFIGSVSLQTPEFLLGCLWTFTCISSVTIQVTEDLKLSRGINVLKSSRVISQGNAELKTEVSEIFSLSIIRVHTADRPKWFSGRVKNFLFSTSSTPALGPTQTPIQWELGLFPRI